MAKFEIYTKSWCLSCKRAKKTLERHGLTYQEIDVTSNIDKEREMRERSGQMTVPQVFINGQHLGTSRDLADAEHSGRLAQLVSAGAA